MFLLSFVSDQLLQWVVHGILIFGITLSFLGLIGSKFPFVGQYGLLLKPLGVVLTAFGIFLEGGYATEMSWRAKVAQQESRIAAAEVKATVANVQIKTVYVDRVKVVKQTQIKIEERIVEKEKIIDAKCEVVPEALSILNDAARKPGVKK